MKNKNVQQWDSQLNKNDKTEIFTSQGEGYLAKKYVVISVKDDDGEWLCHHHTPQQAREIAAAILKLADWAEDNLVASEISVTKNKKGENG